MQLDLTGRQSVLSNLNSNFFFFFQKVGADNIRVDACPSKLIIIFVFELADFMAAIKRKNTQIMYRKKVA